MIYGLLRTKYWRHSRRSSRSFKFRVHPVSPYTIPTNTIALHYIVLISGVNVAKTARLAKLGKPRACSAARGLNHCIQVDCSRERGNRAAYGGFAGYGLTKISANG